MINFEAENMGQSPAVSQNRQSHKCNENMQTCWGGNFYLGFVIKTCDQADQKYVYENRKWCLCDNLYMSDISAPPLTLPHLLLFNCYLEICKCPNLQPLLSPFPPSVFSVILFSILKTFHTYWLLMLRFHLMSQSPLTVWLQILLWSCALGDRFSYGCWSDAKWVVLWANVVGGS